MAIVLSNDPFATISNTLGANTWPARYTLPAEFFRNLEALVDDVEQNIDFLHSKGK